VRGLVGQLDLAVKWIEGKRGKLTTAGDDMFQVMVVDERSQQGDTDVANKMLDDYIRLRDQARASEEAHKAIKKEIAEYRKTAPERAAEEASLQAVADGATPQELGIEPAGGPAPVKRIEVPEVKPVQATTVSKAAKDVNAALAKEGVEGLPDDQLARITSITKESQIRKVAELLDDVEVSNRMAATGEGIPSDVAPQVLFNAVKARARRTGDYVLQRELARSPLATERAAAAQTLGSSGFNNGPADAVDAITEISKARQAAVKRRKMASEVEPEIASAKKAIKASAAKETWNSIVDNLTC